jgi:hypothetical protein|eukprot:7384533-Prymnesium_polylepis.1
MQEDEAEVAQGREGSCSSVLVRRACVGDVEDLAYTRYAVKVRGSAARLLRRCCGWLIAASAFGLSAKLSPPACSALGPHEQKVGHFCHRRSHGRRKRSLWWSAWHAVCAGKRLGACAAVIPFGPGRRARLLARSLFWLLCAHGCIMA